MLKRVVPFVITFALGLFVASIFYGFTWAKSAKNYEFNSAEKIYKKKKHKCNYDRTRVTREYSDEDIIFLVPPPPPPAPPAPPIAPTAPGDDVENTVFPPTPPETVIMRDEIRKEKK